VISTNIENSRVINNVARLVTFYDDDDRSDRNNQVVVTIELPSSTFSVHRTNVPSYITRDLTRISTLNWLESVAGRG